MIRALIYVTVLASGLAVAQSADDAKSKAAAAYAIGQTAYSVKDFATAAKQFAAAYALDPDPGYLFNAAQAFRFDNDCEHARDFYKQFLERVPNPPNQSQVSSWLAEETRCVDDRALKPVPPPVMARVSVGPPPPPPAPSHTLAYAIGGAGIAAIAVGAFFSYEVTNIQGDDQKLTAECTTTSPCDAAFFNNFKPHLQNRADQEQHRAITCYAIGAVALAASTFLYLRTGRTEEQPMVSVAPISGGALVVGGLAF